MATLPKATTVVSETSGAAGGGTDIVCILTPCVSSADAMPRLMGGAAAVYAQHGYCEGVEYAALHASKTGKPFLVVGLPIATPGAISRENKSGNSGSCVTTVTAGGDGVLAEHDGYIEVAMGGLIGTDQIVLLVSVDGGRTTKRVKLGTGNSYAVPYFNVTIAFGAGTLVAGDVIHTWHGSAPKSDASGWADARANLAASQKDFRNAILCGDLADAVEAQALVDEFNAYETENERFKFVRASVRDRLPQATMSRVQVRMTGSPALTFAEVGGTGDTITRASGSWLADGFAVGDTITITGCTASAGANNITAAIASLDAATITLGSEDLVDEVTSAATVVGSPTLTFAEVGASGDTITRSRGSWLTDGFRVGDLISVDGSASNDGVTAGPVTAVTATVLTLGAAPAGDLAAESIASFDVTIVSGETKAAWMADLDAEYEDVDSEPRISLSAGRGRVTSPFSGGFMRRPAGWFASLREYVHDLHIAPWRKKDGPVGASLEDADGNLVEWDDRVDGSAGSAARFTTLRTWANGPNGAFIALSLTRSEDGTLLSHTHNAAVVNLACQTVQKATEDAAIGESLLLNDDGTATKDSLATIEARVNGALNLNLLSNKLGEGPRASKARWTADPLTVFNVAEPVMVGDLDLNLRGTVHSVRTTVRLRSGGQ